MIRPADRRRRNGGQQKVARWTAGGGTADSYGGTEDSPVTSIRPAGVAARSVRSVRSVPWEALGGQGRGGGGGGWPARRRALRPKTRGGGRVGPFPARARAPSHRHRHANTPTNRHNDKGKEGGYAPCTHIQAPNKQLVQPGEAPTLIERCPNQNHGPYELRLPPRLPSMQLADAPLQPMARRLVLLPCARAVVACCGVARLPLLLPPRLPLALLLLLKSPSSQPARRFVLVHCRYYHQQPCLRCREMHDLGGTKNPQA